MKAGQRIPRTQPKDKEEDKMRSRSSSDEATEQDKKRYKAEDEQNERDRQYNNRGDWHLVSTMSNLVGKNMVRQGMAYS